MGALDGYKVLDLSRVLAGPFCAQLFADNGAEVIKVEAPAGDMNREFPLALGNGESTNFRSVNRGKMGIALDLKAPEHRAVLDKLVARADVVIQSFLPRVAAALGVDWARLRDLNPDLIHVTISGYGANGPLREKPGYDTMVAAYSGVMSLTGEPDRPPVRPGVTAIDLATGMLAYGGAVTALNARERGLARGQEVHASLLESGVTLLGFHGVSWLQEGHLDRREGAGYSALAPYDAYKTGDGEILLGAPTEGMWKKACAAMEAPELLDDPRFDTNASRCRNSDALRAEIEARLAHRTTAEWSALLEAAGVATAPINTIDAVLADPQVLANDMVVDSPDDRGGRQTLLGLPFKLRETPGAPGAAPPRVGQHTMHVLTDILDMDPAEAARIAALSGA